MLIKKKLYKNKIRYIEWWMGILTKRMTRIYEKHESFD